MTFEKPIPEKPYFCTREVADLLDVSVTTIVNYARQSGMHEVLIRRRRGDYVFTYNQVEQIRQFAFAFESE